MPQFDALEAASARAVRPVRQWTSAPARAMTALQPGVLRMLIKLDVLEAIRRGEITLQFRRWTRPSVKAGGTLKTKVGLLRIGRIDEMNPADVTAADARKAGFKDLAEFNKWLGTMKQGPLFHRIEVSYIGEP
jgi:hypothetical protein